MMEKIILKAQNEEELKNMISRSLTLKEDETYQVKVLKYPKKILFVNIKGEYEIEIVKKSELKANSEIKTQESKVQSENKIVKKETRNYDLQKESNRNSNNKKNYKNENFENDGKTSQESYSDTNIDKIRGFFKEFIVSVRLDVKIVNVKKENNGKYLVVLDGKDMRFLIGERGVP